MIVTFNKNMEFMNPDSISDKVPKTWNNTNGNGSMYWYDGNDINKMKKLCEDFFQTDIYKKHKAAIGKLAKCKKEYQDNGASLCFEKCPSDEWKWDGAQRCQKKCPSYWKGTETSDHCQHHVIPSTVGGDSTQSVPKGCAPKNHPVQHYGSLCYDLPSNDYEVKSPGFIGKKNCPPGTFWNGTSCYYDRGGGTIPLKRACPPGQRDDGTSCWSDAHVISRIRSAGWIGSCNSNETKVCNGVCFFFGNLL